MYFTFQEHCISKIWQIFTSTGYEASQVTASSLIQNHGATYNTLLIHSMDKYFRYTTT